MHHNRQETAPSIMSLNVGSKITGAALKQKLMVGDDFY